jgi:maleylacetoacetate isomerase
VFGRILFAACVFCCVVALTHSPARLSFVSGSSLVVFVVPPLVSIVLKVGTMFRGKDNALQPNWLHLPVGYHGRSSTVVVTGTPVRRPNGQLQRDSDDATQGSVYGPCRLLDFELEVAAVVGGPSNPLGAPLSLEQAKDRIFGFVLMNDWSARDIQKWEYVPLGPFTAKNFCTTISPWIVMTEALDVAPTSAIRQDNPVPLPYLQDPAYASFDIALTVAIQTKEQASPHRVCESNFTNLYWNSAQQLVHHAVTGCVMKAGDLLGSGTISGATGASFGSMLELSWKGSKEVKVGKQSRKFLKDGDTVVMNGCCTKADGARVGFGDCSGTVLPAWTDVPDPPPIDQSDNDRYKGFVLYGYWRSSSTWRVRVALVARGIDYTTVPVNLVEGEHKKESYLEKNPLGQVPVLEFNDTVTGKTTRLAQSLAIIEFLDHAFPTRKSMLLQDPLDRAVATEIVEAINAGTQPQQNVFFLSELEKQSEGKIIAKDFAKAVNEKGLKAVESLVCRMRSDKSGPYCMGTFCPTVVDACVVPQIYNARRFGVDVEKVCPTLTAIDAACSVHPWFVASHPTKQPDAQDE